jgi:UDP-glucose 4-epimerase
MHRVLITGGDGFLGKRLSRHFNELGVYSFSFDKIKGDDINNYDQLKQACIESSPNILIHLAAISDLNVFACDEALGFDVNVNGTKNVLKVCNELGIRILFASTCCIYGNNNIHPSDEDSMTCPTESYAKSKKISEVDILESRKDLGHTILRLATFYGPEMRKELAPAIFITKSYNRQPIEIHGDGNQTRTMTYVDDIISGVVTVALSEYKYPIINVTTTESVSVLDMVRISQEVTGKKTEVKHVKDRQGQIYSEEISNERLRSFGWEPKTNFEEGMKKSFEFFLCNEFKF